MYTHDNILKVFRNNDEFFNCNIHSHGFEVKEDKGNFVRNNRTYLEIANNGFKIKSEIAKCYG